MIARAFLLKNKNGKYIWDFYRPIEIEKKTTAKHIVFGSLPPNKSVWVFIGSPFFPSEIFTDLLFSYNSSHSMIKNQAKVNLLTHIQEKGYGYGQEHIPIVYTNHRGKLKLDFHFGFYTLLLGVEIPVLYK